jgi:hypothetical protein
VYLSLYLYLSLHPSNSVQQIGESHIFSTTSFL